MIILTFIFIYTLNLSKTMVYSRLIFWYPQTFYQSLWNHEIDMSINCLRYISIIILDVGKFYKEGKTWHLSFLSLPCFTVSNFILVYRIFLFLMIHALWSDFIAHLWYTLLSFTLEAHIQSWKLGIYPTWYFFCGVKIENA